MNNCPCCSHQLLRHARNHGIYWFCSHCRQEMPNFSDQIISNHHRTRLERLFKHGDVNNHLLGLR